MSKGAKYLIYILILYCFSACNSASTLFIKIPSGHSGITFNNKVTENDSINPVDAEFLYNGGGVAVGDFNKDGRPDLYFTASQVSNKMYLNEGDFTFRDITGQAKVSGEGRWCNAASVVDINNDGWQDIYVCATMAKNPMQRTNLLYINQGLNTDGLPVFKEMAKEYNLADTGYSVHAAFFDYDRDGDLDMYLVTTTPALRNSARFDGSDADQKKGLADKLFLNVGSDSLGHPCFKDVSEAAGIHDDGYGLGVAIADINNDGWKDIYVSNDFYSSDLLYINNGDGTFSDKAKTCFKHTSQNAMGNDIADINNDGLADIITVDMNPEGNYRKKTNMSGINYYVPLFMVNNGQLLQYVRNTLQLNNGLFQLDSSRKPLPLFSDIAFFAGVAETDWSWNPSLADFDNDGYKDLIITNGYPKDVTDHDFAVFRKKATDLISQQDLSRQIPQIKIANYAYQNTGDLKFKNVSKEWGFDIPSFSNGAVYADLDNDGDLDYVINNIDDEAFVLKNTSERNHPHNYLNIIFEGHNQNGQGIGAIAELHYDGGKKQFFENSPYRGYLSTVDASLHAGLDHVNLVDTLIVKWPDGKQQLITNVRCNQNLTVHYKNAINISSKNEPPQQPLFQNITVETGAHFIHQEFDYDDYTEQRLLPHKLSQYGPAVSVGDVDNNGSDDIFLGASANNNGYFLLQQAGGKFMQQPLEELQAGNKRLPEMMGTLLFDADGDGDPDLFAASGSNEFPSQSPNYQDLFFVNEGQGKFVFDSTVLPKNRTSKSCVKAIDFDRDGDLDLFVGGRVNPQKYPEAVSSYIYRNDSKNGRIIFKDVTNEIAPALTGIGLICDAVWSDVDNNGWPDLLLAGEWMPITILKNDQGKFSAAATLPGLEDKIGWWNSVTAGDFDNDGDVDFVFGNLGLNSFLRASDKEPVKVYSGDLNNDGIYDVITTMFLPDQNGQRKEYTVNGRDDILKQLTGKRMIFDTYKKFAAAGINDILNEQERQKAVVLKANYFSSCLVENDGKGNFNSRPLPAPAQLSPIYGMIADDINNDGNLDLLVCGNDYGNEVVNGHYDAMNGLVLQGNGDGSFTPVSLQQSGFIVPGDAKGLAKLVVEKSYAVAATQNKSTLQLFALNTPVEIIRFNDYDLYAMIQLNNGKIRKEELRLGSSFLSQSSRFLMINNSMKRVEVVNGKGGRRIVYDKK